MCSINHELKAIYIQIPKTGGSYIHNVLRDCYGFETFRYTRKDHKEYNGEFACKDDERGCAKIFGFVNTRKTGILHYYETSTEIYDLAKITEEQFKSYRKFAFIRNPYDKIVSAWKFIKKVKHIPHTFSQFLTFHEDCDNSVYSHSFIPQYVHLLDKNNEFHIDYAGSFENLNEDLIYILKQIGVTKIRHQKYVTENIKMNVSNRKNYSSYYTSENLATVNKFFHVDFEQFNFKRCDTVEELVENSSLYFLNEDQFNEKNKLLVEKLEKDDILDNIENMVLERKITILKKNEECRKRSKFFIKSTRDLTSTNPNFHVDTFLGLMKSLEKKMHEKHDSKKLEKEQATKEQATTNKENVLAERI